MLVDVDLETGKAKHYDLALSFFPKFVRKIGMVLQLLQS